VTGTGRGRTALNDSKPNKHRGKAGSIADAMIEQSSSPLSPPPPEALDEARLRQRAIGARLRQMFDEVVNEPVPDEFLEILRRAGSPPREDQ